MRKRVRHFLGGLVIESNGSATKVYETLRLKTPLSTYRKNKNPFQSDGWTPPTLAGLAQ
jgi:hypothetical protein